MRAMGFTVLCLLMCLVCVSWSQYQGVDEEMMKKMGDIYGFPYGGQTGGQQGGVQGPPGAGTGAGGQAPEGDQQGSWPSNAGPDQTWPGGQHQGWPAGQDTKGTNEWPDAGWPAGQDAGGGAPQGPLDPHANSGPDQAPAGSGVNTDQQRKQSAESDYNKGSTGQMHPGEAAVRNQNQHHQYGSSAKLYPRVPQAQHDYLVRLPNGSIHARYSCHLHPTQAELHHDIRTRVAEGTKLIRFNILFPEYSGGAMTRVLGRPAPSNPLNHRLNRTFEAHVWQRAYSAHGRTLLSLAFNYDVLSLKMLQFGVEQMDVNVIDSPPGCFVSLPEAQRVEIAMYLVLSDFSGVEDAAPHLGLTQDDAACYRVIRDDGDNRAVFKHRCCGVESGAGRITCKDDAASRWVDGVYALIAACRLASLLFAPLLLTWILYSQSVQKTDYILRLKDYLVKTLLVKRVKLPGNENNSNKEDRRFAKFKKVVKSVPSEEIVHVRFRKLQIEVDHRRLMTESSVPVGLFRFLYEYIFRCKLRRIEPFLSCCKESIFGSWSPRFLWLNMRRSSECNVSCKKCCSWAHLANLLGGALLLAAIPLPYYVRVWVFCEYEQPELDARRDALEALGLELRFQHNLMHYLGPAHGLMILVYVLYVLCFVILAALRHCNANKFDNIAVQAVHDLRSISRCECLRLIFAHLLLPFEKFGICGFVVGLVYWPVVLPVCIIVAIFYCVPTLYLLGRLLIQERPALLKTYPMPTTPRRRKHGTQRTLSQGTSSFETCLLLDNISPELHQPVGRKNSRVQRKSGLCGRSRQAIHTAGLSFLVGILCVIFMVSVLVLFTEVLGFLIEVAVFTLMGAIVNASSAAKYVMLAFWVTVYSTACFNAVYQSYMDLNVKVFEMIKEKLKDDIEDVTLLREERQKNTAVKYFTREDLQTQRDREAVLHESGSEDELSGGGGRGANVERRDVPHEHATLPTDSIEYIRDQLHWRLHHLVMFVDRRDTPHIPKELFERICRIEAPGCPGPVHRSLLRAALRFLYMVVFLAFVLLVVMAFGDVYEISSTNQLLVTLAGGFLPFVVRFVLRPRQPSVALNTYSFEGKIHHVINSFTQVWPVFDLSFEVLRGEGQEPDVTTRTGGAAGSGAADGHTVLPVDQTDGRPAQMGRDRRAAPRRMVTEPSQVDLLITIRDDADEDTTGNLRHSDPAAANLGSHGSVASGPRPRSPDDSITNATNASIFAQQVAAAQSAQQHAQAAAALNRTTMPNSVIPGHETTMGDAATLPVRGSGPVSFHDEAVAEEGAARAGAQGSRPCSPDSSARPVDLMVDMVKGGVLVRSSAPGEGATSGTTDNVPLESSNGPMPRWNKPSPYKQLPTKEGESCV